MTPRSVLVVALLVATSCGGVVQPGTKDDSGNAAGFGNGAAPSGTACTLLGRWSTHSAPWNGQSTDATIVFLADGTFTGEPEFRGLWSLDGTTLSISDTTGADMTCSFTDQWTLTFSADCTTAPLLPIGSGCTGGRRYLDWDVTLTRQ